MIQLKTKLLVLTALLLSIGVQAQSDFSVAISMGNVQPLGDFKLKSDLSNGHGFSETGFTLNFDGDYYLHNRFCVSGKIHFGNSQLNELALIDMFNADLSNYLVDDPKSTSYDFSYWLWSAVMIGAKYNYPIVLNKLYIEVGAFSGFNVNYLPDQSMLINDEANERQIISENKNTTNLSLPIMAEGGFRYRLNELTELKLSLSYFQTKAQNKHHSYIVLEDANKMDETLREFDFNGTIKTLNTTIGLVYRIQ